MEEFRLILNTIVQLIQSNKLKEAESLFKKVLTFVLIDKHHRQILILSMYFNFFYLDKNQGALHFVHIQLKALKNMKVALGDKDSPQYRALLKEISAKFKRLFAELKRKIKDD